MLASSSNKRARKLRKRPALDLLETLITPYLGAFAISVALLVKFSEKADDPAAYVSRIFSDNNYVRVLAFSLIGIFSGTLLSLITSYFRTRNESRKSKTIRITVRHKGKNISVAVDLNDPSKVSSAIDLLRGSTEASAITTAIAALRANVEKFP